MEIAPNKFRYQKVSDRVQALGTINPLINKTLFDVNIPKLAGNQQSGKWYFFSINFRNGMIEEDIIFRREGPNFSHAYKVVRFTPEYLDQPQPYRNMKIEKKVRHIDPGFPVHELTHLKGDSGWIGVYENSSGSDISI